MNIKAAKRVQNRRDLSLAEKAVAYAMAVHASYEQAEANMSMTLLAAESGLKNRETASRIVERLEAKRIIAPVSGRHSKGGRGQTTTFVFILEKDSDSAVTVSCSKGSEKYDLPVTVYAETVTENAETVTPQSQEGFKVFSYTPPVSETGSSDKTDPNNSELRAPIAAGAAAGAAPRAADIDNPTHRAAVVGANDRKNEEHGGDDDPEFEPMVDRIETEFRRRRLDRRMKTHEIFREYNAVYDRVGEVSHKSWTEKLKIYRECDYFCLEKPLRASAAHKGGAARIFRTLGSIRALHLWEQFLVYGDHRTTTRFEGEVQRDWLLGDFVEDVTGSRDAEGWDGALPDGLTWLKQPAAA